MGAINYACFKLEEKPTRSVKKNKKFYHHYILEINFMGIIWKILRISKCKKHFIQLYKLSSITILNN